MCIRDRYQAPREFEDRSLIGPDDSSVERISTLFKAKTIGHINNSLYNTSSYSESQDDSGRHISKGDSARSKGGFPGPRSEEAKEEDENSSEAERMERERKRHHVSGESHGTHGSFTSSMQYDGEGDEKWTMAFQVDDRKKSTFYVKRTSMLERVNAFQRASLRFEEDSFRDDEEQTHKGSTISKPKRSGAGGFFQSVIDFILPGPPRSASPPPPPQRSRLSQSRYFEADKDQNVLISTQSTFCLKC
eukprot:TRINITY_DN4450_c0_g2_i6.p1 TRINITY_DN4450_c0_g2~~TRINITY_DN4450_c0_g2_i6.p1  ORF type:complete len:267 (-),score=34.18 TRINITY_DN4450_c0_g2_i6:257-997(-)